MSAFNEEDEIEKVKALSLITAQEDEKRRQQKYGGIQSELPANTNPVTDCRTQPNRESPTGASLISRPRPQPRSASREGSPLTVVTPAVPPRPDPQRLEHARLSHAHAVTTAPSGTETPPRTGSSPVHRATNAPPKPPPPKHPPHHPKQHASPSQSAGVEDKPLITLSPPTKTNPLFDFDLDSLDPLKNGSGGHAKTSQPKSTQSLFTPSHVTLPSSNSLESITTFNRDSRSSNADNFVAQNKGKWAEFETELNSQKGNTHLPYSVNPFAVAPTGYFNMQRPSSSTVSAQPHLFLKTNSSSALNATINPFEGMSNPFTGDQQFGLHKPHKLSLSPTTGRLSTPAQKIVRIPSDSNIVMNVAKQQAQESVRAQTIEIKRTPSIDWIGDGQVLEHSKMKEFNSEELNLDEKDDLMSFADPFEKADHCLSLESFDPLFSMDTISEDRLDSTGLFTNPCDKYQRRDTPNPFPGINALTTKDLLEKVNAMAKPEKILAPASARRDNALCESTYESLQAYNEAAQDEVKAFCDMVARLKLRYPHSHECNKGYYESSRVQARSHKDITVKVIITARFMKEPYIFTPSLETSVQHMICEVLLSLTDNLESTSADDYLFKVHGRSEFFLNESKLGDYEYVHNCLKIDEDIKLVLFEFSRVSKTLLRSEADDKQPVLVPKHREIEDPSLRVTRDKLNILMETYYREIEKLRDEAIQAGCCSRVRCKNVVQAVKAICATLYKIESADVIKAVGRLQALTVDPAEDDESTHGRRRRSTVTDVHLDDLHIALEELTKGVKGQIDLFCRTFQTDFRFESAAATVKEKKSVKELGENVIIHVATAHRLPITWRSTYEEFKVKVAVYYAGQQICGEVFTQAKPVLAKGLQDTYIWDEWIQFESLFVNNLPREARLCLQLIGVKAVTNSEIVQKVNTPLGWVALQLFNHKFELVQGGQLLGLWHGDNMNPVGTTMPSTEWTSSVLLQINLPDFDCDFCFPSVLDPLPSLHEDFSHLHPMDQEQLQALIEKDPTFSMSQEMRGYVWGKRHYLQAQPRALPRALQAVPAWRSGSLHDIYSMIHNWTPLTPIDAMELLLPSYPDTFVRTKAVEWISATPEDELCDCLPQLIQALKFESYHTSALARMLIEKCLTAPRVAHQIYWLLKEAADDVRYRKRYQLMFGALLSVVGVAGRQEFGKEEDLVKILASIAEKVKAAKEKENVLQRELMNMWEFFDHSSSRIPLNPSMQVVGLDVKSCSYFSSNAFPLKLVFKNIEPTAESIYTMFKSGDDLRQDMLTMQIIRIMDKLWLKDGLDLRIVTFRCQATGVRKGFVELVTESDTLRKIQIKHGRGVAGSFKETTIREWLQLQNPTELEYEKAVNNFTASCAGYCVATYVLGICDRHNDNIMVKHSGHLFHIDFGKFLGDSQMFGSIKRDRTPFVLTADMAYVINSGDKMSHRFQEFIDYCCAAFNILRKHTNFFVNLFQLMVLSAIPGVNEAAIKYVQRALLPDHSDVEATAIFTRMIEQSLASSFTQLNFFIHNLAQMKFSGHAEGALLSFIPKTYSIHTDGKIKHIELAGFQKRYNPEKYYIYIIKIERENQKVPSFVFRRYSEFQELHHKLVCLFPLVRLPNLSNKVILGRTHVKTVAEERKFELQVFLRELLALAPEVSEHDVVYTFCHPMLRDEQDINKTNIEKLKEPPKPRPQLRKIDGQIKLSIFYKNEELTIMVMHVKDLAGLAGNAPDPYVKIYLLPDPLKVTKRKTKIAKSTFHPTYNEMLTYRLLIEQVKEKVLSASVWNFDALKENEFLGSALIPLSDLDLSTETTGWYPLATSVIMAGSPSPRTPAAVPGGFV